MVAVRPSRSSVIWRSKVDNNFGDVALALFLEREITISLIPHTHTQTHRHPVYHLLNMDSGSSSKFFSIVVVVVKIHILRQ